MTTITQTLHHHQQQISHSQVTLEEAVMAERLGNGHRYTYEAPTTTPDLLLTRHHLGEVVVGRACIGDRGVVVSVYDATTLERLLWDELTAVAEPVTVSGWYPSRVAGWVLVEWDRGSIRVRAWASDRAASDRYDGISPAERAARDAQNDLDARISAELAR
ncbi:MAG: hypothetical protein ACOZQL_10550 [Myxococcota bacterium]